MYRGKRIVITTPAGRLRYLNVLKYYVLSNNFVDEWKIWQNTTNPEDVSYINELAKQYKKITVETRSGHVGNSHCIFKFFNNCTQKDTVYIRFDDDIVWMDHRSIINLLDHRIDNPEFFLVYGNIINNAICDHLHQRFGAFPLDPHIGYNTFDSNGWSNPMCAEQKHRILLNKIETEDLQDYIFPQWVLNLHERVSINVISWLGEEFEKFKGVVGQDEEEWLAVTKPRQIHMFNAICGTALFSHFAFYTQRDYLDKTKILSTFEEIAKNNYKAFVDTGRSSTKILL